MIYETRDYLFSREQQILDDVLKHIGELQQGKADGLPVNRELFEALAREYGIMLKHMRKVVEISDKASGILIEEQKSRQNKINDLENQLLQKQISIMLSQIQPHFLYNSLVVIRQLCRIDPKLAEETVVEFSDYLRGNLDSLTISEPISFEQELRHVKTYLAIEKKRLGNKLNIVYNIKAMEFMLPALTLQPIVENAVRYGITKKEGGGTVTITTESDQQSVDQGSLDLQSIVITVTDDGAGFDPQQPVSLNLLQDGRSHVGIENVRSRLAAMCGGSLEIHSKPGEGTTAVIAIPKTGVIS